MRRLLAVTLLCLLLAGCTEGKDTLSHAVEFRAALVQAGGCSFQAEITADFGETVESFTVSCEAQADGETNLTILEPETLAGITATVTQVGGKITYDGMMLDFGLLADESLAPAAAPSLMVACWSGEYISSAGNEDAYYRASYEKGYDEDVLKVDTWFENGLPIYAEVCYNDARILQLKITDFEFY